MSSVSIEAERDHWRDEAEQLRAQLNRTRAAILERDAPLGPPTPLFHEIKLAVCAELAITPEEFDGPRRREDFVTARRRAWFLARRQIRPQPSLAMLGRLSGGRDHSTIAHGVACEAQARAGQGAP